MINIIEFNEIGKNEGKLISLEVGVNILFDIKRVYYIFEVPKSTRRGYHSHKQLKQVLVCINGSVKIDTEYNNVKNTTILDSANKGLYLGSNVWREMYDFSQGAVLMVLASEIYDEKDYIRDYSEFKLKEVV